jgi:hypothetical protein
MPKERCTAWRSEYSVASVTSLVRHRHHDDGHFLDLLRGSGLGW